MLNIKPHLRARGMTQTALADALEITRGYMSLLIAGKREPSPAILARMAEVLEIEVSDLFASAPVSGFQDGAARPYNTTREDRAAIAELASGDTAGTTTFRAARNAIPLGILTGDVLLIDLKKRPRDGDIVLATRARDDGTGETAIFRLVADHLISTDPTAPAVRIDGSGDFAIMGGVTAIYRALRR